MPKKVIECSLKKKKEQLMIWEAVFEEMAVINATERYWSMRGETDKYEEKRVSATFCCPKCLGFLKISDKRCPICGLNYSVTIKETIRNTAFEFAAFAWNYRRKYEEDIKNNNGRITVKHELFPPQDWLTYLASIVLVAILSGISYDLFKLGLLKIAKQFARRFKRELPDDKWLKQFYVYLKQFFVDKRTQESLIFHIYLKSKIKEAHLSARLHYIEEDVSELTKEVKQQKSTKKIKIKYTDKPISQKEIQIELKTIKSQIIRNERALAKLKNKLNGLM